MTDPWQNRIVATADVDPAGLVPHRFNFRVHPDQQAAALGGVLDEIGLIGHVLVNRTTGHIIDGHLRRDLALERGQATIPVAYVELTPDEEALALATFDAVGSLATTDAAKLDQVLADVQTDNAAINALLDELRGEVLPEPGLGGDEFDAGPLDAIEPRCATGELWLIDGGRHRLLIGDATSAGDVGRLMDGERPFLMVTDPPYGVEYDAAWRDEAAAAGAIAHAARRVGVVANDHQSDWAAAWRLAPADVVYCWFASQLANQTQTALEQSGFAIRNLLIWAKPRFAISRGHYNWQHEPCWYAVRRGSTARWCGDHSQSTVWEISLDRNVEGGHSTQKPLECMARPIRNHGAADDIVYDPFLGSGTTIIAAHRTGRRCYGLEIEPRYGEVILRRCEAEGLTVERAVL